MVPLLHWQRLWRRPVAQEERRWNAIFSLVLVMVLLLMLMVMTEAEAEDGPTLCWTLERADYLLLPLLLQHLQSNEQ